MRRAECEGYRPWSRAGGAWLLKAPNSQYREQLGCSLDHRKHGRNLCKELTTQPNLLALGPSERRSEVCSGFGPKQKRRRHQPRRCSMSSRTSRQGLPRVGSAWCNASRRSNSWACAGERGMSSGVRLSHSSSTSWSRSPGLKCEKSKRVVAMSSISVADSGEATGADA